MRCQLCTEERTFSRNDTLTRHMRIVHPDADCLNKARNFRNSEGVNYRADKESSSLYAKQTPTQMSSTSTSKMPGLKDPGTFPSRLAWKSHERSAHTIPRELQGREDKGCVFCGEQMNGNGYSRHVGRHMEEIAFSVVSKPYEEWSFYSDSSGSNELPADHLGTHDHVETMPATNRPSLDGALGNYDISATIKDAEPTLHRTSILPNLDGIPAREPVYPPWHENHVSKVLTYSPKKATVGTAVEVRCRSNSNNFHSQSLNVSLVFGGCCVPAKILTIKPQAIDTCFRYVVGCSAPPLPGPNSSSDLVRLRLLQDATLLDVGPWQYEDGYKLGLSTSPLNKCRKLRLFSA